MPHHAWLALALSLILSSTVSLANCQWSLSPIKDSQSRITIDPSRPHYVFDHVVFGQKVFPASGWLDLIFSEASKHRGIKKIIHINKVRIQAPLTFNSETVLLSTQNRVSNSSLGIDAFSKTDSSEANTHNARADGIAFFDTIPVETDASQSARSDQTSFYQRLNKLGLGYGPNFQLMEQHHARFEVESIVRVPHSPSPNEFAIHPALLDAAMHAIASIVPQGGESMQGSAKAYVPVKFSKVWLDKTINIRAGSFVTTRIRISNIGAVYRGTPLGFALKLLDENGVEFFRIDEGLLAPFNPNLR